MSWSEGLCRLNVDDAGTVRELILKSFVTDSVLHAALDIEVDDYGSYLDTWLVSTIAQGLSWIIVEQSCPTACLLAVDYDNQPTASPPAALRPMTALLGELEAAYEPMRPPSNTTALVDLAAVSPEFRGRGLYRRLREAFHADARAQGFTHVVGELSSAATQRVCIDHFGHRVVAQVAYNAFEFEGLKPFDVVVEPDAIRLVEGELR